jgi:peptidoglycan/LPS O-acetylase OafA/YrhL
MVLAAHVGMVYHDHPSAHPSGWFLLPWIWWKMCVNGRYGVDIFFVVSGFLITRLIASNSRGLYEPDYSNFYARRIGRILPLLILTLGAGALATYLIPDSTPGFRDCFKENNVFSHPFFWVSVITFWANWYLTFFGNFGIYWMVLWSLSVEEQFYFFYPFFLRFLGQEKRLYLFLGVFVFLSPLSMWIGWPYAEHTGNPLDHNSFVGFGLIATGALLFLISGRYREFFIQHPKMCWFLCLLGFGVIQQVYLRNPLRTDYGICIWGNFLLGSGVFLFLLGALHLKIFESKYLFVCSFPGRLSYGMYLLHTSAIFLLWSIFPILNEFIGYIVCVSAVTVLSLFSYRYFEMPANRFFRRILGQGN